jgi:hypothetical protein
MTVIYPNLTIHTPAPYQGGALIRIQVVHQEATHPKRPSAIDGDRLPTLVTQKVKFGQAKVNTTVQYPGPGAC